MRRISVLFALLLCLTASAAAQLNPEIVQALNRALNDINEQLDTEYFYESGDIGFRYEQRRIVGDNLGCESFESINMNPYFVTTVEFDLDLDEVFEWEYRYANDAQGERITVVCRTPNTAGGTVTRPASPTPTPTLTSTPTPTPTFTPTPDLPILIGRDGPRVLPPIVCDGLLSRLIVGSTGRVIVGDVSNNLRQYAALDAPQVGDLFAGSSFTVVDGPVCVDDVTWYAVEVGGELAGWTAEGQEGDYYIEPVLIDALPIVAASANLLQPVGQPFAPGTVNLTSPYAGLFAAYDADSATVWALTPETFTLMNDAVWGVNSEVVGQLNYIHRDYNGLLWTADALSGALYSPNEPAIPQIALQTGMPPVLAIDMQSDFLALATPNTNALAIYNINLEGPSNTLLQSLTLGAPVRDVVFSADSMMMYVATDNQILVYRYELGSGWQAAPAATIAHDQPNPRIAVSLNGAKLAVTGLRADGIPGLRVYTVLIGDTVQVAPVVALDGQAGTSVSRPAISPDGSVIAVSTSLMTVRLIDANTGGQLVEIASGGFGPVSFSLDSLFLLAPVTGGQLQMYGLPLVVSPSVTLQPTFAQTFVPTATPVVIVPTLVPTVIVATFAPTATVTLAPTLPPPPTSSP